MANLAVVQGGDDFDLTPGVSACPACAVAPMAARQAQAGGVFAQAGLMLSVPQAHCALCISALEGAMMAVPGVISARLNLTLRRLSVEAEPQVTAPDLIAAAARAGYEAHEMDAGLLNSTEAERQGRDLLMRLGVAFFSMMNVMLLSVAVWAGAEGVTRDLFHWISAAIALPTVAFAGQPFFRAAYRSLRAGRLGMDVPISLALILASSISLYETIQSGDHAYFDAAVMLTFFLLAGRYLDHRTRAIARSAAQALAALEVPRATVLRGGAEVTLPLAEVMVGDLVRVRPGGRMPVDGTVEDGQSEIDRSVLTGESLPVFAGPGTQVSAGEVNLTGPLLVKVLAAGRESSLHRMADLVAVAESARTTYTSLAERAAAWYSPLVHLLSFSAFGFWMWQTGGDLRFALNISAAVLIITCPCALGLAVPAVVTSASGKLFRKGLLIKNGTALERLAGVDVVVFDKTGTLTMGAPKPTNLDEIPRPVLAVAMALAAASSHPLAQSLVAGAEVLGVQPVSLSHLSERPGYGVEARYQGNTVRLGRADWCGAEAEGVTASYVQIGGVAHSIRFADRLRPGAGQLIGLLKAQGLGVHMLSGDAEGPVRNLAERLGLDDWTANTLPEEKARAVTALREAGHRVLMVGDGLNDTAALLAADVSISPASALDAARVASDIVLLGTDLVPLADALRIARQSTQRIVENFVISGLYNVVAVPIALMGFATPLAAAAAMSLSSITVSLNALRLR